MKAQVWELSVSEGVLAAVHGFFNKITEYYIPECKLAINPQAYFLAGPDRYVCDEDTEFSGPPPIMVGEIDLPSEVNDTLLEMAAGCRAYDKFKEKMFESEEDDACSVPQN